MQTGLVLTVPAADPVVGDWRARFDPSAAAGMPAHVTLIYPFKDSDALTAADRETLAALFARFPPIELGFSAASRAPEADILWLEPKSPARLLRMIDAVVAEFPDYPPFGGAFETVIPHLTIAHADAATLARIEAELAGVCIRQKVFSAALVGLTADGWRELERFPLRSGD